MILGVHGGETTDRWGGAGTKSVTADDLRVDLVRAADGHQALTVIDLNAT
jgi:hypothetical protein